jgi:hypothetical protein
VRPTGKRVASPDGRAATIEEVRNVVPARYNVQTQLQVEVKPDGENTFEFALSSRNERNRSRS